MELSDYTIARIYELRANGHPNAVPAFGSAVTATLAIERGDFEKFLECLEFGLSCAGFWGYSDQREYAQIFCGLCLVDPALLGIQ